jgi:hypothetical protein
MAVVQSDRELFTHRHVRRFRSCLTMAALVVTTWATTALAQTPQANFPEESGGMVDWLVALALAGIACGAGFWNPKRTHQN